MKTALYILGLLSQRGPQHGYRLHRTIAQQIADFAKIKPPTVYYHLEKLEGQNQLESRSEKAGKRPERSVYTITEKGRDALRALLLRALDKAYDPEFLVDGALMFATELGFDRLVKRLEQRAAGQQRTVDQLEAHQPEALGKLQGPARVLAQAIFEHHRSHHRAEIEWLRNTIDSLNAASAMASQTDC